MYGKGISGPQTVSFVERSTTSAGGPIIRGSTITVYIYTKSHAGHKYSEISDSGRSEIRTVSLHI